MAEERIDLLDRQPFVDKLLEIAVTMSDNKQNTCYAINAEWGVGKSFVLDLIEKQAEQIGQEGEELSRFCVFRYNCWEYDYYEEPLISLIAAMLDDIAEKSSLFPTQVKTRISEVLCAVGNGLLAIAGHVLEEKTGFDLVAAAKTGLSETGTIKKEKQSYDGYSSFKKALTLLRVEIEKIAEHQTVVFLVDELDRCLPTYAVKILERLHHLTEGLSNVQVVLAVDREQLEHTVKKIYGDKADAKKYLRKFVDFELKLPIGDLNENYDRRFGKYVSRFRESSAVAFAEEIHTLIMHLLGGIDMRQRIALIEKCDLLHTLLFSSDTSGDIAFMCLELFLSILYSVEPDMEWAKDHFSFKNVFEPEALYPVELSKDVRKGLKYLSDIYAKNDIFGSKLYTLDNKNVYVNVGCIEGVLLFVYRKLLGFCDRKDGSKMRIIVDGDWDIDVFADYGKRFWNMLQTVH